MSLSRALCVVIALQYKEEQNS